MADAAVAFGSPQADALVNSIAAAIACGARIAGAEERIHQSPEFFSARRCENAKAFRVAVQTTCGCNRRTTVLGLPVAHCHVCGLPANQPGPSPPETWMCARANHPRAPGFVDAAGPAMGTMTLTCWVHDEEAPGFPPGTGLNRVSDLQEDPTLQRA